MTRTLNFIEQNQINSTHIQKQSAVIDMKESVANDTAILFTMKNNVDLIDNATSTHVQKQSTVINIKENDANDTTVLSTMKNNVDSTDNATSIHVQKQSAVINIKESDANDTAVLNTMKNNIDSANNAASIHVQKQSAVINIKENDANDTAVLNTMKSNVDSANNAAKFDKFVKSVHSQWTDKSEDLMNKIHTLLYFSWKRSRFNHSKKDTTSITLTDQTLHYSKSLKYMYKWQTNNKWFLQRMMRVLNHCIQNDESWTTRCRLKKMTCQH